MQKANFTILLM